jgi:predicted Zn-ribbon and HTH transcriptional regulator
MVARAPGRAPLHWRQADIRMLLITSCTVLAALAGIFILIPLFRESASGMDLELLAETELDRLLSRKTVIYKNLKDLEFEFKMGRLSDADFRQLEADYKNDAAVILQKLEQLGASEKLDESIEKDIAARKAGLFAAGSRESRHASRCPACGVEVIAGKKFCADCGHKL